MPIAVSGILTNIIELFNVMLTDIIFTLTLKEGCNKHV